jgi:hypothetical protein
VIGVQSDHSVSYTIKKSALGPLSLFVISIHPVNKRAAQRTALAKAINSDLEVITVRLSMKCKGGLDP